MRRKSPKLQRPAQHQRLDGEGRVTAISTGVFMGLNKIVVALILLLSLDSLVAQEIDKSLYRRTTLDENFSKSFPEFTEYYMADVKFNYSSLSLNGDEIFYDIEDLDGNAAGTFRGVFGLLQPEEGQTITIYFRLLPLNEYPRRRIIDYIEIPDVENNNPPADVYLHQQSMDVSVAPSGAKRPAPLSTLFLSRSNPLLSSG